MAGIKTFGVGLRFSFSVIGAEALSVDLSRFADEITDYRPFWNGPFLDVWRPWIQQAFATQGASTGRPWAPLSPSYAAWKARRGYAYEGLLVRSGDLSSALMHPERSRVGVWDPQPSSLRVGTTREGAIFHQTGTRRMPARPPIRPTKDFMLSIGKALQVHVAAAWSARRRQQSSYSGA